MKRVFLLLFIPVILWGQDTYQEWLKKENARYQNFISEEDKRFADFLEQDWKKFQMFKGVDFDETPKLKEMPVFVEVEEKKISEKPKEEIKEEKIEIEEKVSPIEKVIGTKREDKWKQEPEKVINPVEEIEKVEPPIIPKVEDETETYNSTNKVLNYYGYKMEYSIPQDIKVSLNSVDNKSIAEFWKEMSGKNFNPLLEEVQNSKEELGLNDWGYIQLLNEVSRKIYGTENSARNERYLFIWFMLVKSQYKAKVGIIDSEIYLLLNSKNTIFRTLFYTTGSEEKQYVINLENLKFQTQSPLYTFDEDFPGAEKLIKMDITKPMKFDNEIEEKKLSFIWKDVKYVVPVKYSKTVVNLFSEYPYSNLDIYFNSAKTNIIKESLLKELAEIIKGKSTTEAANILLRFSQEAFKYKTDPEQFGYEKPLFVEEILFYPYSDCEDRSIMFAFLVRSLLGLDVIAVDYPGHVATAVDFGEENRGDKIKFQGREFTVCDPTYLGAKIGHAQPKYVNSKIENLFFVK